MADLFISFKFTGEPQETLEKELGIITSILTSQGHNTYCSLYDEKILSGTMTNSEIYDYCLDVQKQYPNVFVYTKYLPETIKEGTYSTGVNKEVKKAKELDQMITLFTPFKFIVPFYRDAADEIIEYIKIEDLQYLTNGISFK